MACERDRIEKISKFLMDLGVEVNIGKNKARGNKGFFKVKSYKHRIDIALNLSDDEILHVLVHEFAHYLHYTYDHSLKSLEFIFENLTPEILEEMICLTVDLIPKSSVTPLYNALNDLKNELKSAQGVKLELKKKMLYRLQAKISRLNRYYNQPTELFARTLESYFMSREDCSRKAPIISKIIDRSLVENKIPVLTDFYEIFA